MTVSSHQANEEPVVIYLDNRFFDPIILGTFWLYVRDLFDDEDSGLNLQVISYEDDRFPITEAQTVELEQWRRHGLEWTALKWHSGTELRKKIRDLASGLRVVAGLRSRGFRHMFTFCSVAEKFGCMFAQYLGMRLFLYSYEPHSQYAIDNGMWPEKSL